MQCSWQAVAGVTSPHLMWLQADKELLLVSHPCSRSLPSSPLRGTLLPGVMTHHQSEQQRPVYLVTVAVTMIYG